MSIFSETKSSIKQIWTTTFKLYKKAFFHTWPLGVVTGIIITSSSIFTIVKEIDFTDASFSDVLPPMIMGIITVFITSLFIIKYDKIGNGGKISWPDILTAAAKKFFILFFSFAISITLDILGLLAFIAPGIFLFILFTMIQPLILLDNNGIIKSIKNSSKLVWGNWWRTFSIIGPLITIGFCISFFTKDVVTNQKWPMLSISVLSSSLFYPLFYAAIITLFSDLKIRRKIAVEKAFEERNN